MTVAEVFPPAATPGGGAGSGSGSGASFDRTPPQDVDAERSVLGAMLLSKDAIADVVECIRQVDFYRPAHQTIFEAVTDLFTRGEPADAITVSNWLTTRGDLGRVGGPAYLHTLVADVPTAANAAYYAEIVRDRAVMRRLVEAGTRIVQWGYAGEGDVDQVVDRAQAEVFDVTSLRTSEDYAPLADIMDAAVSEIEGIASRGGEMVGVPTGFIDLDRLTNGLHPGQLVILAARPAIGKALALDTPIPTPTGWATMGDLRVGQQVLGTDGHPATIVAATPTMTDRRCRLVEFSDGSSLVADADHQWVVRLSGRIEPVVRTTDELRDWIARWEGSALPVLPEVRPLDLPAADLPIPPYALGVWLAHGEQPAAAADPDVAMWLEADHWHLPAVDAAAAALDLSVGGFVPRAYLRASVAQRRDLLAGVLDVAGEVDDAGAVSVTTTSRPLAQDLFELLGTLGICAAMSAGPVRGRRPTATIRLTFTCDEPVFRLHRKDLLHKDRWGRFADGPAQQRFMTGVTPIPAVPVRCIEVDNESHVYLAGRAMVPTHNSTLGLDIARSASIRNGLASVIFSLEMSKNEIVMRLLSAEAQVPLHNMRSGRMHDPEWRKIAARQGVLHEAPLYVDDSPNMTMTEIRAKCRRLKQRNDLRLVIVDYMQLMTSGKKVESRQQEVSEFSRSLKLLAKELEVPVVAISQLNRGPEARNDKKPMLSDLRESGCLTASTRVLRADTGAEVTMGELYASGAKNVLVWSLDDSLRYRPRTLTHVFRTGHRDVYRVRTVSGRVLEATANHPLLTYSAWTPVGELTPGTFIGISRHVPAPLQLTKMDEDEVVLLGQLLGDSAFRAEHPVEYASRSSSNVAAVERAARNRFGVIASREEGARVLTTTLTLPIAPWLAAHRLMGLPAAERFVPAQAFAAPKEQVATFLRHLWAGDGVVSVHPSGSRGSIHFTTPSRRLADDVARLLLRFGVLAAVRPVVHAGPASVWQVAVEEPGYQRTFLRRIGGYGLRARAAADLLAVLESAHHDPIPLDESRHELWEELRQVVADSGVVLDSEDDCDDAIDPSLEGRHHLQRMASVLDDMDLDLTATNDVFWDEIEAIDLIGSQDVFDATVLGSHNFVADGVAVHNSLEQDADMVILIHREDAYDRESNRVGEADLIVAKHRNGPTDTITVAFQGHYSRFVDMARE